MEKLSYLAILEKQKDGYSVFFPDLPGCISWGKDLEEAQEKAKEALELHLYGLEKEKLKIPVPSKSVDVKDSSNIVCLITVYPQIFKDNFENKKVKVNVTISNGLKKAAMRQNINFSQVLEIALKQLLEIKTSTPYTQ